jgi:hypothetical protein
MIIRKTLALVFCLGLSLAGSAKGAEPRPVDFETEIRPLLQSRCGECHGPKTQTSDLRLDARHAAFKGGLSGEVIVPFSSGESELVRRITSDDKDERMPPEGKALSKKQIDLFKRWIDAGAVWPETDYDRDARKDPRLEHWSFVRHAAGRFDGRSPSSHRPLYPPKTGGERFGVFTAGGPAGFDPQAVVGFARLAADA